jgi:cytochrome c oxidase cbb3-type subunit 4
MDMGTLRGIVTAVLLVLFVAIVVWAYSRARREEFAAAARRPLDDDRAPPAPTEEPALTHRAGHRFNEAGPRHRS